MRGRARAGDWLVALPVARSVSPYASPQPFTVPRTSPLGGPPLPWTEFFRFDEPASAVLVCW
jgi:hypothetical protein